MAESGDLAELSKYVEDGVVTVDELIEKLHISYVQGQVEKETYEYGKNYFKLLEKILSQKKEGNTLIDANELVNFGLCDDIDEVHDYIKKAGLEDYIRHNPVLSPAPTKEEIDQIYDSEDPSKVCITCTHRKRHVLFLPCGHSAMCSVCSERYVESKKREDLVECIICKKEVRSVNRVYMS
jgi:hypothetical protein